MVEIENVSWFSRLGSAVKGILFGIVLFLLSFVVLFWNEGRAVDRSKQLAEGKAQCVAVAADKVDPANDGKTVHISGQTAVSQTLTDPQFGVQQASAVRLVRKVEMYQWEEKIDEKREKKLGGGETVTRTPTYSQVWSSDLINSDKFMEKDKVNKKAMPVAAHAVQASKVAVGAFTLAPEQVSQIDGGEPIAVDAAVAQAAARKMNLPFKVSGNYLFLGEDLAQPKVGNVRVSFEVVKAPVVSLVARQSGSSFARYDTSKGSDWLFSTGAKSAEAMFQAAEAANSTLTWVLRLVGFVMMVIGIAVVLSPLKVLADVVPFVGSLVGAGTGIIALVLSLPLSMLTIAVAWMFYRPVMAVAMIVAGVAVGAGLFVLCRKRKKVRAVA